MLWWVLSVPTVKKVYNYGLPLPSFGFFSAPIVSLLGHVARYAPSTTCNLTSRTIPKSDKANLQHPSYLCFLFNDGHPSVYVRLQSVLYVPEFLIELLEHGARLSVL